jgi:hypothetical protein
MATEVTRWPQKAIDGHRSQEMAREVNRWPQKSIDGDRRQ